jgi:hypothetical protein
VADVFDEVDEQIRAERARAMARRAIPWFIGALVLCVAVVLGVWGWDKFNTAGVDKASEAYAKGMEQLQGGNLDGAATQFAEAAKGPAGYKSLSLMQQAGIKIDQKKDSEAVALLDQAAKAAPDKMIGDAASLKAAYLLLDTAPLADVTARLQPLIAPDRPYHSQAREALALAKMAAGKTAEAKSDFSVLQLLADTPETMRQRASAFVAVIDGGTAGSLKALVQAAAAAPPVIAQPGVTNPAVEQSPTPDGGPQVEPAPPGAAPDAQTGN